MSVKRFYPRRAHLILGGWAGTLKSPVEVVEETPKRYRIRAIQRTRLAGRSRYLEEGDTILVPKGAVRFEPTPDRGN